MANKEVLDRTKGIGGSDVAAILGVSQWTSQYEVWQQKVGIKQSKENVIEIAEEGAIISDPMGWGDRLESIIASYFEASTGKKVKRHNKRLTHAQYDFLNANVDRMVIGEKSGLEIKTANQYKAEEFKDSIPIEYQCQIQHYMNVTNYKRWYLAVLIGGQHFLWRTVERDDQFISFYQEKCINFWKNNVLTKTPPEVGHLDWNAFSPSNSDKEVELEVDAAEAAKTYLSLIETKRNLDERIKGQQALIKKGLADKNGNKANTGDASITFTTQSRTSVNSKKLRAEFPDAYAACAETKESHILRIKKINRGGDAE